MPSGLHDNPLSFCLLSTSLPTVPSSAVASVVALRCGVAQSGEQWWGETRSCHGNPAGIWCDWGDRMGSTEETGAEEVGCRRVEMEGCCWWTCSGQPWCSDPRHGGNWDGPVAQASLGSWSKGRNWNLTRKRKNIYKNKFTISLWGVMRMLCKSL